MMTMKWKTRSLLVFLQIKKEWRMNSRVELNHRCIPLALRVSSHQGRLQHTKYEADQIPVTVRDNSVDSGVDPGVHNSDMYDQDAISHPDDPEL